jgi:hypothetical protein
MLGRFIYVLKTCCQPIAFLDFSVLLLATFLYIDEQDGV